MYGFCGSTNAHCGAGCQSGDCLNAPAVAAPGASPAPAAPVGGAFNIVGSSGVPAMHAALMPNGRVMFLDKLENYTQLKLPNGYYAMSSEYDPATNAVATPLAYKTNAFCSGGTFLADGRVVSLGGNAPLDWLDQTLGMDSTPLDILNDHLPMLASMEKTGVNQVTSSRVLVGMLLLKLWVMEPFLSLLEV
ncbi:hypothetical protein QC760_003645 [Botrytis cinerea]